MTVLVQLLFARFYLLFAVNKENEDEVARLINGNDFFTYHVDVFVYYDS